MNSFNLFDLLVDQLKLLVKETIKKDKVLACARASLSDTKACLSVVHGDLENLLLENASLAHKLNEASIVGLTAVSESFENDLLQLEHFYSPLCNLRE